MATTGQRTGSGEQPAGTAAVHGRTDRITGFVNVLVQAGLVDKQIVAAAIAMKQNLGAGDRRQLFQILIDEFSVDREAVYREFVTYYSFKTIDLSKNELNSERISFISKALESLPPNLRALAHTNKILPYGLLEGPTPKVQIITPDPINPEIGTVGRALPFPKYEVYYVALKGFEELNREVLVDTQNRPTESTMEFIDEDASGVVDELDEEIRRGHLAELVDGIFGDAVRVGASDIHIIPKGPRNTEVFFRIDSRLTLWRTIDDLRADAVAAVVKDVSKGPDRFERNMAQDGFIQKVIDSKIVRFRVSIIPIVGRELKMKLESIVIRVLRDPEGSITIENIGFDAESLKRFKAAISKPHGIVVLTGPTGSGKSTTLLAAIRAILDPSLNIITVEDPVEYFIDGTRQVKLNPKLDFEQALRAILRHDPDIVMVGEIRDKLTADLAIKLANTGHLTFSTLHTNDAPGAIARLYKMGIEPFLLAYALNIVVAQRLLRKLCERCKLPDEAVPATLLRNMGFSAEVLETAQFFKPVGCIHCIGGYKGRKAIHETLYFTPAIRKLILDSDHSVSEDLIRETALLEGMKPLRQVAFDLLLAGITSVEEVAATTSSDSLTELE
jgi:type IV pilus assembly protein PilB